AIELNPNYALAHQWLAFTLLRIGQPEQSIEEMNLALRLDPLSSRTNITYEYHLLEAKQYQEAVDHGLTLVKSYPENAAVHGLLATAYEQTGRLDKAGQEFDKFLEGNEKGRSLRAACQRLSYRQCKQQFSKIQANKELIDLEQKHK